MNDITKEEAEIELGKRELGRRHLDQFIKYFDPTWEENWHHRLICNALERVERGELKRLMIFVPPQNGKSTIASENFPAYYFGKHPEDSIIASSYAEGLAVGFGRKARNTVGSQAYKRLFPLVTLSEDSQAAGNWITNKGGEYYAVGIGGGSTGHPADVILIDDPVKDKTEAESIVIQDRNYDWYKTVARTRLSPKGAIIVIQTRWHDQDLAGRILANEEGWEILSLPAIAETDDAYRKKGDPLWPSRYSMAWLMEQKKAMGLEAWSSLYQQTPLSSETQTFKPSYFIARPWDDILKLQTRCFVTIDPAPGKTQQADSIGVCVNFVDSEGKWNLIAFRVKFDAMELIKLLFKLQADYNVESFGIEQGMYKDVLKPFLDQEMVKRGTFLTIIELKHEHQAKHLRIKGLQPMYEARAIFHIEGMCGDLEEELLRFPKALHDDVSDAAAYQTQIAEPPGGYVDELSIQERRQSRAQQRQDSGV